MRKKHVWITILLTLAVVLTSSLTTRKLYAQSQRKALIYEQAEKFLTAPDTYGMEQRTIHAIRGDGSTVEVKRITAPDGTPVEIRIVSNLALRRRVTVDGLTASLTTYSVDPGVAKQLAARPQQCSQDLQAPHSVLLGYDVVRDERDLNIGGNGSTRHVESWRAPGLECLALAEKFTLTEDGKVFVTNIRDVTSVSPGEPDQTLFDVPSAYVERLPSEVMAEFNRRYPSASPVSTTGFGVRRMDEAYRVRNGQQ